MIRATIWHRCRRVLALAVMAAGILSAEADDAAAGHRRVQEIALSKGWNAVFLEVEPSDGLPERAFAGLPVDRVATWYGGPVSNQFVTDPGVDLFKSKGWSVWYAPGLPEAFLKSLDVIEGNRAYLIHARQACQWRAAGRALPTQVTWRADAFNFVGFPVRSPGGPTFAQFFAGSKAHAGQAIYRLADGRWRRVLQPAAESMRSGEAFWIFCKGPSHYQGPLRVETASRLGLLLGRGAGEVILRNASPHPLGAGISHVPGDAFPLPLSILVRAYGSAAAPVTPVPVSMPAGAWDQPVPPLETGASLAIPLECRGAEMGRAKQGSLLKITSDLGTEHWVPLLGFRDDLGD